MLTRRTMEVGTGLVFAGLGALVAYGSLENGIGWTAGVGPAPGYFPFRIGLLVVLLGVALAIRYAFAGRMRRDPALAAAADATAPISSQIDFNERFFHEGSLKRIASVFVPTAVAAALIPWLGIYIASVIFLIFTMRTLGHVAYWKAIVISVGVLAAFYVIFEFWFQVPLAKGLIMPLFGLY